jgi:hypothetical protein
MHNEFEKQVQQKMEGLHLIPSEPVWEKIEMQILIKKDRRKLFLWLPLLFILLGGGVWWVNGVANKNEKVRAKDELRNTDISKQERNDLNRKIITYHKQNRSSLSLVPNKNSASEVNKYIARSRIKNHKLKTGLLKYFEEKGNKSIDDDQTTDSYEVNNSLKNLDKVYEQYNLAYANPHSAAFKDIIAIRTIKPVIIHLGPLPIQPIIVFSFEKKTNKLKEKNWKIGITGGAGVTGIGNGISLFGRAESLNYNYSTNPSSGPSVSFQTVSNERSASGYWFGLSIKRKLSERVVVSSGIEYRLYTTIIKTGVKVEKDTVIKANNDQNLSVSQYYDNSVNSSYKNYTNRYHYLSVPVSADFKMVKSIPVTLHAGLSLQYLVSTNALQNNGPLYYFDPSAFRKLQLFSEIGFNYSIEKRKAGAILIGPQIQYGLSGIKKNNPYYHFYTLGFRANYYFK